MSQVSFDDIIATYAALKVIEVMLRNGPITLATGTHDQSMWFEAKQGDTIWSAWQPSVLKGKVNTLPFLIRNIAGMET